MACKLMFMLSHDNIWVNVYVRKRPIQAHWQENWLLYLGSLILQYLPAIVTICCCVTPQILKTQKKTTTKHVLACTVRGFPHPTPHILPPDGRGSMVRVQMVCHHSALCFSTE